MPVAGQSGGPGLLRSRFALVAVLAATFLVTGCLTRLVLAGLQARGYGFPPGRLPAVLGAGLAYDLLVTLWLCAPVMLLTVVLPGRAFRGPLARVGRGTFLVAGVYAALFIAAVEIAFFAEFNGRFGVIVVDALASPNELGSDIWDTYPTGRIIVGVALAVATVAWATRGLWARCEGPATSVQRRVWLLLPYALVLAMLSARVDPGLMRVSEDRAVNQIAGNGYYALWMAFRARHAAFEHVYATLPDSAVDVRLDALLRDPASDGAPFVPGSVERHIVAGGPAGRHNVVVILEESLGSRFVGSIHPEGPRATPSLDALIAGGTLFTRAFSTGSRTVRAIEAVCMSLPPLPGLPVIRRPASVGMATLPAILRDRGYATEFFYSGRASFDGMDTFLRSNGVERIVDQSNLPPTAFQTAWGVADEVLFDRALFEMDSLSQTGRPFFALLLTVSNHPPYSYPAGRIAADPAEHRQENAVRYADWALGRFIAQARTRPYFDNTLFVVLGDHGPHVYGPAEIPMPGYEVPILLYAPAILPAGRRIQTVTSSMDVAPTILGVLNESYASRFFGQDALRATEANGRALMIQNNELALLRGGRMAVLGPRRTATVYTLDQRTGTQHRHPILDATDHRLIQDAISYYAGADRMYRAGRLAYPVMAGQP
jgi:phosphoglycerol transferase MdoB-like AlkP superfamily enzyme